MIETTTLKAAARPSRTQPWCCVPLLCGMLALGSGAVPPEPPARESEVKATLLLNLCRFVEWPSYALGKTNDAFVIGILGADPFGKFLDELVRSERVYDRLIEIRRFRQIEEAPRTQILFIAKSEQYRLEAILSMVKTQPVLTVTDVPGTSFLRQGGIVSLITEKETVRMGINAEQARLAGLVLNAKLLRVAETVRPGRRN